MNIVEFHPEADRELHDSALWYNSQTPGLGDEFLDEVGKSIEAILVSPQTWPSFKHNTRRRLVHRFPYGVVYRIRTESVWIVAIAHLRRRPDYWANRLSSGG